jgi:L-alanine-DL-glutamate epimerase-like enolase superfamily enzyme
VRIIEALLYELNIPFVEAFSHSAKTRGVSDSFVVKLIAEDGTVGYGEGVARTYVTGETVESSTNYIENVLWPVIRQTAFNPLDFGADPVTALGPLSDLLPEHPSQGVIAWNAARTAVEMALLDCLLKTRKQSLARIFPPKKTSVTYSGVITSSSVEKAVQHAKYFKLFGIQQIKVKVGEITDIEKIVAIRDAVGLDVSLRLDANGAYTISQAIQFLNKVEPCQIASVEQPIPRGKVEDLAEVKRNSPVPIMVDESLITLDDAQKLVAGKACDFFNLRISKCGGLKKTLEIARFGKNNGILLQLGCQVGETAILSAAGRHLAAYLDDLKFVEGSYGRLLLSEDISRDPVQFGHGGRAPVLKGIGLGVEILDQRLEKYALKKTKLQTL